jgi:hypothetical protein
VRGKIYKRGKGARKRQGGREKFRKRRSKTPRRRTWGDRQGKGKTGEVEKARKRKIWEARL